MSIRDDKYLGDNYLDDSHDSYSDDDHAIFPTNNRGSRPRRTLKPIKRDAHYEVTIECVICVNVCNHLHQRWREARQFVTREAILKMKVPR